MNLKDLIYKLFSYFILFSKMPSVIEIVGHVTAGHGTKTDW